MTTTPLPIDLRCTDDPDFLDLVTLDDGLVPPVLDDLLDSVFAEPIMEALTDLLPDESTVIDSLVDSLGEADLAEFDATEEVVSEGEAIDDYEWTDLTTEHPTDYDDTESDPLADHWGSDDML